MRQRLPRKLKIAVLLVAFIAIFNIPSKPGDPHIDRWRSGDIIFLNGTSLRSRAVRLLQGYSTDYSHVGIVVVDDGIPYVVHADPTKGMVVKQQWDVVLGSGQVSGAALYKVREHADGPAVLAACEAAERYAQEAIPFDNDFDLKTANKLYCTELVLRAYRIAGIDLCEDAETEHPHLLPGELLKSAKIVQVLRF